MGVSGLDVQILSDVSRLSCSLVASELEKLYHTLTLSSSFEKNNCYFDIVDITV